MRCRIPKPGAKANRVTISGGLAFLVLLLVLLGIHLCRGRPQRPTSILIPEQGPSSEAAVAKSPGLEPSRAEWAPPVFTERQEERDGMVEVIRRYGLEDKAILRAMRAIPRHEFVQKRHETLSYADRPLDIGYGQTISQPYIVAAMTHLLDVQPGDKVLEIGTGSGYQASVLTHLTTRVYTIEIIKELAESAKERCVRLGYDVIEFREGDGYYGWPSEAPFEGIIVTAAAGQIPPPLVEQLAKSGRMVIPVGPAYATQWLMLLEKDEEGRVRSRSVMPVRFVPLVRETK